MAVGTIISFWLITQVARERITVRPPAGPSYTTTIYHQERTWWLLAPNPFVVLADSAPRVPTRVREDDGRVIVEAYDPLSAISDGVRRLRVPARPYFSYDDAPPQREDLPVWPYGLGFQALLGVAAVAVTTVRLRTPSRRLARGVRVA
jgi:hypothetical protein